MFCRLKCTQSRNNSPFYIVLWKRNTVDDTANKQLLVKSICFVKERREKKIKTKSVYKLRTFYIFALQKILRMFWKRR